ncbi:MAG: hypothetical protein JHC57_13570 [Sphingopyxis sp.]|uniref:hypothetical protein n=1 Tax=Sphingopyxis sp. TaxID=1908224 RepID=UPI001A2376DC|nr:hypothetical protein [Sphingopyxis sp.]MBJ7500774.1 hypothetical protein [Sphingopyxis sp.]
MRRPLILSAIVLSLVAGAAAAAAFTAPGAAQWVIGPVIRGKNYSQGMPLQPRPARNGWYFDFPVGSREAGHVHYVTFRSRPIPAASTITLRYRVDARPGTRFVPQESEDAPATVSLYFQRRGDNWSAKGRYEHYRWYAPAATVQEIAPGEHEMRVRLDDPDWISVMGRTAGANPGAIGAALADIDRIGLVFGSASARGHGVFATAPARFTLLGFEVR